LVDSIGINTDFPLTQIHELGKSKGIKSVISSHFSPTCS
jgi:hypothetical protein